MSRWARIGLGVAVAVFFFVWHAPLLSEAGRIRGFNSDAAIIALMGKKMLDGRGFDIFFWGQNYIGPLTSMFIAAAGALSGGVNPLALRIGTMTEILAGILLAGWAVSRIDVRAGFATMVGLAITPPVILRMMITPLGAEMAFLTSAALLAMLLSSPRPLPLGLMAGFAWWMNQQVVFTLLAAGIVLGCRSPYIRSIIRGVRPLERWRLRGQALGWRRPLPGLVEAFAWVLTRAGLLLFVLFIIFDVAGVKIVPFVFGRAWDALLLLFVPLVALPLLYEEWRHWRLPSRELVATLVRFSTGFALGYAPVWLGRIFDWYPKTYVFSFRLNYPSATWDQVRSFGPTAARWIGAAPAILGILYAIAFCAFVGVALWNARTEKRVLLALVPLTNFAFYVMTAGGKEHYLIASVAMLFGVAALGGVDLWDRSRRSLVATGMAIAVASLAVSANRMHRDLLREPDPLPLLAAVRSHDCAVTYADYWIAYRYRFLDGERSAWIPNLSQNRTRAESVASQHLPGQRCLAEDDGSVVMIPGDLPLVHPIRR